MMKEKGKLYGIGVGPGDPELVTVKAARILGEVDMVFAASSSKNPYSLAVNIVKHHIPEETPVMILPFPMTKDKDVARKAWKTNAGQIIDYVSSGKKAAFITLGDPMTYSTFGYVLENIQILSPELEIETIPGITSYQACASRLNVPLVEGEESLFITSGVEGGNRLRQLDPSPENVVFLKAYKNAKDVAESIEESGMINHSVGVSCCGLANEEIIRDVKSFKDRKPGYWTVVIAKKSEKPAL